jgi:hypothetical protein
MVESQVMEETGEIQQPRRDINDVMLRALIGLMMKFLFGRIKKKRKLKKERMKAGREIAKLAKKGKEIPDELRKEATRGLSRRKKKKYVREAKKARKKRRFWVIIVVVIAIALAIRFAKK